MSVFHLVLREVAHRKLNFVLALASVAIAVGSFVGAMTLLKADSVRTNQILAEKQKEVEKAGAELKDAMRKIMKGLGFNIWILPKDQDLSELQLEHTASKTMPEEYAHKLANSRIITINHLLPMITRKIQWPEQNDFSVVVVGTRGEIPLLHRIPKKPIIDHVPAGTMVIGHLVAKKLGVSVGDKVTLLGRQFTITKVYPERGTVDDSTVWINLKEAQELFGLQNLINAILALECNCAAQDRVAEIRAEISSILPGTQVIEVGPPALARAEARKKAAAAAKEALEREKASREQLRRQRESLAAVLVPVVVLASAVWIAFLAFTNVRQRSAEIGILRAIGLRSSQILSLFLGKAAFVGIVGAFVGYAAGFAVGVFFGDLPSTSQTAAVLFAPALLVVAVIMALLLSILGSWIPSLLAARQDPAVVLQNE
ncbi:MAG: FtsX-like permease family protein [Planctomycetes bacterium]|nr:FtsX-like permease family protein [Planctomycetota bacterium]